MPKKVRVNIRTKVDNAAIRHENREGRAVIIVPSATLPDDIVMNGILYPADEIAKSFETLERTPAPLGHPFHGNQFIPATDPEAINSFWVGAHNENVRQEDGRVLLDKVIDVENAGRPERGLELLNAIEEGDPIHTSTGIFMEIEESKRKNIRGIARNMVFDHDAILIGEQAAATPDQGVGTVGAVARFIAMLGCGGVGSGTSGVVARREQTSSQSDYGSQNQEAQNKYGGECSDHGND